MAFANSFLAPTKFEPWSDRSCWMGPLIAVKHLKAVMKALVVMSSNCSICSARELVQVTISASLFSSFPLSLAVNGPKQSIPQYVKGGVGSTLSSGRSAIFWPSVVLLCRLQWTHLEMCKTTAALRPSIHIPWERILFIVIPVPWCLTLSWKWSMISSATWEHLGRIIGCLTSNGKVEFSSLSPTLVSLSSSMKGSWGLCLVSLGFCSLWRRLAISVLGAESWGSLIIRGACHYAKISGNFGPNVNGTVRARRKFSG